MQIIYPSLHCHHQNDCYVMMGSEESHFNGLLIVRNKLTRQCPQTTTFEVKGQPKRIRTEVSLLTSLRPYRQAKPVQERLKFYTARFDCPRKWLQHSLFVTWLVPRETTAISAHVLCTPFNHAPIFIVSSNSELPLLWKICKKILFF